MLKGPKGQGDCISAEGYLLGRPDPAEDFEPTAKAAVNAKALDL